MVSGLVVQVTISDHGFAVRVYWKAPVDHVKANVADVLPIRTGLGELNLSGTTGVSV